MKIELNYGTKAQSFDPMQFRKEDKTGTLNPLFVQYQWAGFRRCTFPATEQRRDKIHIIKVMATGRFLLQQMLKSSKQWCCVTIHRDLLELGFAVSTLLCIETIWDFHSPSISAESWCILYQIYCEILILKHLTRCDDINI